MPENTNSDPHSDDRPPFGKSWVPLYATVIGVLVALIVLFTLFTRAFS